MVLPLLVALLASQDAAPAEVEAGREAFELRVRPVLEEHCVECHGGGRPKAGLDLSSPAGIAAGGDRGLLIAPGDAEHSLLAIALGYQDPELLIPPEGRLADAEIEGIRAWVDGGAHLPEGGAVAVREDDFDLEARAQHWSFQPIADPPPARRAGPALGCGPDRHLHPCEP